MRTAIASGLSILLGAGMAFAQVLNIKEYEVVNLLPEPGARELKVEDVKMRTLKIGTNTSLLVRYRLMNTSKNNAYFNKCTYEWIDRDGFVFGGGPLKANHPSVIGIGVDVDDYMKAEMAILEYRITDPGEDYYVQEETHAPGSEEDLDVIKEAHKVRIRIHGGITESRAARAARLQDIKQFIEQLPPLASYQAIVTELGQPKSKSNCTDKSEFVKFYFPYGLTGQKAAMTVAGLAGWSSGSSEGAVWRLDYEWGGLAFDANGQLLGWKVEAPPDPGPHGRETHFTLDSLRIEKK